MTPFSFHEPRKYQQIPGKYDRGNQGGLAGAPLETLADLATLHYLQIEGTGPRGTITRSDLLMALSKVNIR